MPNQEDLKKKLSELKASGQKAKVEVVDEIPELDAWFDDGFELATGETAVNEMAQLVEMDEQTIAIEDGKLLKTEGKETEKAKKPTEPKKEQKEDKDRENGLEL